MKHTIFAVIMGLAVLSPTFASAQVVALEPPSEVPSVEQLQAQQIELLLQIISLLQQQLAQLTPQPEPMPTPDKTSPPAPVKKSKVEKSGSGFKASAQTAEPLAPASVTVKLPDGIDPPTLTLWGSIDKKNEFTNTLHRTAPGTYSIELTGALEKVHLSFDGGFEIRFPDDLAPQVFNYTVIYNGNGETEEVTLHKDATIVE